MNANIHSFNEEVNNNGSVGISNSNNYSTKDDKLIQSSIYNIRTVTFVIICTNVAIFLLQSIIFYIYYQRKGYSWGCLLVTFGASQAGKIVNHYQYFRLITPILLHNSFAHLCSNSLSLVFLGFHVENDINNKINYFLLYGISGIIGNFSSILIDQKSVSIGASGAVIGLCGNFVVYFILNYKNMSDRKKYSYGFMFLVLFMNLFSGLSEGGESINMYSHIGGFLGGLAFSIILTYRKYFQHKFNQGPFKKLYYISLGFLVFLPIITLIVINSKKISNLADFICYVQKKNN